MTCKECVHYEVCDFYYRIDEKHEINADKNCEFFKDKNQFVEVKRGEWIKNDLEISVEYTCSVCGYMYCEAEPKQPPEKYCCKCGAINE